MNHDEWVSQIVQAVHAANQGNPQELHHLASLLEAQETQGPVEALETTTGSPGGQGYTFETPRTTEAPGEAAPEQEYGEERR